MKKTIVSTGALILLSACSMNLDMGTNPDESFDNNYQGSPEIEVMEEVTEPVIEEEMTATGTEVTGTGDVVVEEMTATGTEVTGTGEVMMEETVPAMEEATSMPEDANL